MKSLLIFILLTIPQILCGQTKQYPVVAATGTTIDEFVPKNWKILQKTVGDLNKDNIDDVALVLQEADKRKIQILKSQETEYDTVDTNQRILIVLFKDSIANQLILKERTNTFVINRSSPTMSEPFQGMVIQHGVLKIEFFLWYSTGTWYQTSLTYIFRFQKERMTLIGAEYDEVHRGTSEATQRSFNFSTKKMSETKSKLDGNGEQIKEKTNWSTLPVKELKTLSTLKQPLGWEPMAGIQI